MVEIQFLMTVTFFNDFSDGAGRTGVFLAIDANSELAEEDSAIDVFGYVKLLRGSRRGLVESLVCPWSM